MNEKSISDLAKEWLEHPASALALEEYLKTVQLSKKKTNSFPLRAEHYRDVSTGMETVLKIYLHGWLLDNEYPYLYPMTENVLKAAMQLFE